VWCGCSRRAPGPTTNERMSMCGGFVIKPDGQYVTQRDGTLTMSCAVRFGVHELLHAASTPALNWRATWRGVQVDTAAAERAATPHR
jgi:hypothetical protein